MAYLLLVDALSAWRCGLSKLQVLAFGTVAAVRGALLAANC
ncbi:MAG TPA: hypothetical protein VIT93_05760 [Dehalococcoidia bacterium]